MARSRPWRNVEWIDSHVGPKGGEYWFLTLSCGHHKSVAKPSFKHGLEIGSTRTNFAPYRVRCLLCMKEDDRVQDDTVT